MSRIGKHPVPVPAGVDVKVEGLVVTAKGKNGQRTVTLSDQVTATIKDGQIVVLPANDTRRAITLWATSRSQVNNLVTGVSEGFRKNLEIVGVGYRARVQDKNLILQLGYSHDVIYSIPEGIAIACEKPTMIEIFGADKQQVGQVAAEIRAWRPPEPYKGKGIKYAGEQFLRKEGKKK
ncbi:MAG: 50S ribosomal protein L6 [Pseudomonadota bacterium]|nr:50S ribosomal protein L6 [Pseudomonadota bacterium]